MVRKGRTGDDGGWDEPGIGGDPDAPRRPPGSHIDHGKVGRIAEDFWRACDMVPLSIPRWSSRGRMNANIQYLVKTYDERTVKDSFEFFRSITDTLTFQPGDSLWDQYFRRNSVYLRQAARAHEGGRPGDAVHKAGDIRVDNTRFQRRRLVRKPPADTSGDDDA